MQNQLLSTLRAVNATVATQLAYDTALRVQGPFHNLLEKNAGKADPGTQETPMSEALRGLLTELRSVLDKILSQEMTEKSAETDVFAGLIENQMLRRQ